MVMNSRRGFAKAASALSELLAVSEDSKLNADAFGLASYYDVLQKMLLKLQGDCWKK